MTFFHKSNSSKGPCGVCKVVMIILGVIVLLSTIVSLIGVYKAHLPIGTLGGVFTGADGFSFGSTSGSLSLIALALNIVLMKKCMNACPCQCNTK